MNCQFSGREGPASFCLASTPGEEQQRNGKGAVQSRSVGLGIRSVRERKALLTGAGLRELLSELPGPLFPR